MADNNINGSSFGDMLGQAILAKRFGINMVQTTEVERLITQAHAQETREKGILTALDRHRNGDAKLQLPACVPCSKNEPCRGADYADMVDRIAIGMRP